MRNMVRLLLRSSRLRSYLKRLYFDAVGVLPRAQDMPEMAIPELSALNCRVSNFDAPRLNLLVPDLALRHVFGGIATALDFFRELAGEDTNLRIVLTDSLAFNPTDNPAYKDWNIVSLNDEDGSGLRIIPAGDRYGQALPVCRGDRFVATAWWTAALAREIQKWQVREFSLQDFPRFLYLIQDYEPGFYPWSARYALADATYRNNDNVIALFNTSILRNFFENQGYEFPLSYEFEPRLSDKLRQLRDQAMLNARERRILVYGRPSVPRNAFQIIVEGLRHFISTHPDIDWTFVSAGEAHPPIELGMGRLLNSVGKLTIEQYAQELGRSSIGISLMISPHPSYPPLEMATFGMHVLTNRYKSKDLSVLAPNIHSLDEVSPQALSERLATLVSAPLNAFAAESLEASSDFLNNYLNGEPEFNRLSKTIRAQLL